MNQSVILQLNNITKTYPHSPVSTPNSHRLLRRAKNSSLCTTEPAVNFDQSSVVLDRVSLTLHHGELLGLLGPSGCGKTTLLRIVAGFESISQGTVAIAGKVVCTKNESLAAEKRHTGMVFQDYALFPHLTVAENIAFGLKHQYKNSHQGLFSRKHPPQIKQRVGEVLELVGLRGFEQRYPHQLSGGQQQRISLARALAPEPALILLDEPLSNLDVQVRHRLRAEIRAILKSAGTSAIFVTHDREEALAISDKIAVMRQGRVEQVGTPEEVYLYPASHFVAEFVTQANFVPATKQGQVWVTEIGQIAALPSEGNDATEGDLMVRPEDITLIPDPDSSIVVRERQFLGREYYYGVETASGKKLYARMGLFPAIALETKVSLSLNIKTPQIFEVASKRMSEK